MRSHDRILDLKFAKKKSKKNLTLDPPLHDGLESFGPRMRSNDYILESKLTCFPQTFTSLAFKILPNSTRMWRCDRILEPKLARL